MEKIKFKIVLFLLVTAICGLYAHPANEPAPFYENCLGYAIVNEKLIIIDYAGKNDHVIILEKLGGYEVTSIGDGFGYDSNFVSIEIPNFIIIIENGAFRNNDSLTKIVLNEGHPKYNFIDRVLFDKTKNSLHTYLASNKKTFYAIPNFITSIGNSAFDNCDNLTTIKIPNSVTSIGAYAFYNCDSLTTIEIPNSVTNIGNRAFSNCDSLTTLEIPDSVTSIGGQAFQASESLTSIKLPNSITSIDGFAFSGCESLISLEILDSVTSIGRRAFEDCKSLTKVEIPNSVISIGKDAFYNCRNLILTLAEGSYAHKYALENDINFVLK